MHSALVAGHICLDLVPALRKQPEAEPGDLVEVGPLTVRAGGCVANTGGDLGELGISVRVTADVGSDVLGETLLDVLRRRGVDTSELRRTDHTTSYSVVVQPPGRDRTFWHHVGANQHFDGKSVDLEGNDLLHVGYPSTLPALVADRGRPLRDLLERARRDEITTSLDLAVVDQDASRDRREAVHERWQALFTAVLPLVDVISPSVDDMTSATGRRVDQSPASVLGLAEALVRQGAAIALVSAGTRGMALATGPDHRLRDGGRVLRALGPSWSDVRTWHPVEPVAEPVTTTGAGDAATAGLLCGLMHALEPERALALASAAARARVLGRSLSALAPQP